MLVLYCKFLVSALNVDCFPTAYRRQTTILSETQTCIPVFTNLSIKTENSLRVI